MTLIGIRVNLGANSETNIAKRAQLVDDGSMFCACCLTAESPDGDGMMSLDMNDPGIDYEDDDRFFCSWECLAVYATTVAMGTQEDDDERFTWIDGQP